MSQEIVLTALAGPHAGREIRLQAGSVARIGRSMRADFFLPEDTFMSGAHFLLEFDQKGWLIRDLNSSNGTIVNGTRIDATVLRDGDKVIAGQTTFLVHIKGAEPAPPEKPSAPLTIEERLLGLLRGEFQPLYAILDAAREPDVFKLLVESREEFEQKRKQKEAAAASQGGTPAEPETATSQRPGQFEDKEDTQFESLFEGASKGHLAHFAPYLVRLPPRSPLLERLVRKGWGKSWGIYLTCDLPFAIVRNHFRHFLMVKDEDGKQLYFRFYDPRVLRLFLPTCTAEEINQFFGPAKYYLMEDEKPEILLRFASTNGGAGCNALLISITGQPGAETASASLAGEHSSSPGG